MESSVVVGGSQKGLSPSFSVIITRICVSLAISPFSCAREMGFAATATDCSDESKFVQFDVEFFLGVQPIQSINMIIISLYEKGLFGFEYIAMNLFFHGKFQNGRNDLYGMLVDIESR